MSKSSVCLTYAQGLCCHARIFVKHPTENLERMVEVDVAMSTVGRFHLRQRVGVFVCPGLDELNTAGGQAETLGVFDSVVAARGMFKVNIRSYREWALATVEVCDLKIPTWTSWIGARPRDPIQGLKLLAPVFPAGAGLF